MGSKASMPTPPPAPQPIDPGKSALDFTRAMADPVLQGQILASEQMYRPQYTQLELNDINTFLQGSGGQMGLLDIQDLSSRRAGGIGQELTSMQRAADIADVEALGGRATAALRAADPMQQAIVNQLNALAADRYAASGQLSPQEMRGAQQAARLGGLSRGRVGDVSTVASEVLNREQALAARRQEALQAAQMAFAANQATAADPFQAILGRPAQAPGMGMASTQFAAGLAGQPLGPNLFDPNAGINLGLQQNANQANYQSSIYGAQAGYAGATNQGRGAAIGGAISGLGALAGGALSTKAVFICVPEGQAIDTPNGSIKIEDLRAGDMVIGFNGEPVIVHQKHEYNENPEVERFYTFTFDNGSSMSVCDMHRIAHQRAMNYAVGDSIGDNTIVSISIYGGVKRSYDLLTGDVGYRMSGIPVDSMIEELAAYTHNSILQA